MINQNPTSEERTVQPIKEFEKFDMKHETPNGITLINSKNLSNLDDEDLITCGRCGTVREDLGEERDCPTCTVYDMIENLNERLERLESGESQN